MTDIIFPTIQEWGEIHSLLDSVSSHPEIKLNVLQAIAAEIKGGYTWENIYNKIIDMSAGGDFVRGYWIPESWYLGEPGLD